MAKSPAWQRAEGKKCDTMLTCKGSIRTSSVIPKTALRPFALNAGLINRSLRTIRTANAKTEQSDTGLIADRADLAAVEKIGLAPYTPHYSQQAFKNVRSAMLKNLSKIFTPTAVLRTAQKSTAQDVSSVCLNLQKNPALSFVLTRLKKDLRPPKISYLEYSITQQIANNISALISILSTYLIYTNNSKADALYPECQ
jgi:hypothetical protein